jgi:hypothetical protein
MNYCYVAESICVGVMFATVSKNIDLYGNHPIHVERC